jgi:Tol biopolymer transport system component
MFFSCVQKTQVDFKEKLLAKIRADVDILNIIFSPNGNKVVYAGKKGNKEFVVVNDKKEEFDLIGDLVFSPDGKKLAYIALIKNEKFKRLIVVDGKKTEEFDDVWQPVFSPDGKKVMFYALKSKELWKKVIDVESEY